MQVGIKAGFPEDGPLPPLHSSSYLEEVIWSRPGKVMEVYLETRKTTGDSMGDSSLFPGSQGWRSRWSQRVRLAGGVRDESYASHTPKHACSTPTWQSVGIPLPCFSIIPSHPFFPLTWTHSSFPSPLPPPGPGAIRRDLIGAAPCLLSVARGLLW